MLEVKSFACDRQHPLRCMFLLHVIKHFVWVYVFINIAFFLADLSSSTAAFAKSTAMLSKRILIFVYNLITLF